MWINTGTRENEKKTKAKNWKKKWIRGKDGIDYLIEKIPKKPELVVFITEKQAAELLKMKSIQVIVDEAVWDKNMNAYQCEPITCSGTIMIED